MLSRQCSIVGVFSRRSLLTGTIASFATAGLGTLDNTFTTFDSKKSQTTNDGCDGEVLGQDPFRYRAHRHWGVLDRTLVGSRNGAIPVGPVYPTAWRSRCLHPRDFSVVWTETCPSRN